jgi:DNA-binding CsgD family transcriptional regulator
VTIQLARMRSSARVDERWIRIEAARLEGQADAQVAVTLRAATAAETFDLLCRAYALSRREREVVSALLAGLDTRAVSRRLLISAHTVNDHLKSVFRKTGVHGRRSSSSRASAVEASDGDAPSAILDTQGPGASSCPRRSDG